MKNPTYGTVTKSNALANLDKQWVSFQRDWDSLGETLRKHYDNSTIGGSVDVQQVMWDNDYAAKVAEHVNCTFRKILCSSHQLEQAAHEALEFRRQPAALLNPLDFVSQALAP